MLHIVADENIPCVQEAFAEFGTVTALHGRKIDQKSIQHADALLVRTTTHVDRALLGNSPVRFVASATAGYDHVNETDLADLDIPFHYAPGSNASSVADYVTAALLRMDVEYTLNLSTKSIGIVGFGHVGKQVAARSRALGLHVVVCDPPLERATAEQIYRPLEEVLQCDIVTLHTPLTHGGFDPTYHLANEEFFSHMKAGSFFINTARGGVMDTEAVHDAVDSGILRTCVLDVFEKEPEIDRGLARKAFIATPHIAGYGYDGKIRGTQLIYEAFCAHFNLTNHWNDVVHLPSPSKPFLEVSPNDPKAMHGAVEAVYDIGKDHERFVESEASGHSFDNQRKTYPIRREFSQTTVTINPENDTMAHRFSQLGFKVR
jgi:erythronate-4-phosphate dehydrogenase